MMIDELTLKGDEIQTVAQALAELIVRIENGDLENVDYISDDNETFHDKMGNILMRITKRENVGLELLAPSELGRG